MPALVARASGDEGSQIDERAENIEARNTDQQAGTSGDGTAFVAMCLPNPSNNRLALCLYGVEICSRKKPGPANISLPLFSPEADFRVARSNNRIKVT